MFTKVSSNVGGSVPSQIIEARPQDEDDISLNNRKMVLNFGDKGEEEDSENYK